MKLTKSKVKPILTTIAAIAALTLLASLIQDLIMGQDAAIRHLTQRLGIAGPIFLMLGIAFGGVFVPMTALPFLLIGLSLYGFWEVFLIYHLGNTIIAPAVDFYIARRWGRPVVAKLAGKRALVEIDKFAAVAGYKSLIIMRFVGGIFFDTISYAIGLTRLDFKKVMLITAVFPIPGQILTLLILKQSISVSPFYMGLIILMAVFGGLAASYLIYQSSRHPTSAKS